LAGKYRPAIGHYAAAIFDCQAALTVTSLFGFQWQHPWYLLALLTVLVPLLIHLLHKSRGRIIPFAHIALLKVSPPQPTTELRLNQLLLWLLRSLIFLLAALLIAEPIWSSSTSAKSQIFVSRDWLNQASAEERSSLTLRLADVDVKPEAIVLDSPASPNAQQRLKANEVLNWQHTSPTEFNLWAKLQSHIQTLQTTTPLIVYATNAANQFVGNKLNLSNTIDWQLKTLHDSVSDIEPVALNMLIVYDQDRSKELRYIQAALKALQQDGKLHISVKTLSSERFLAPKQSSEAKDQQAKFSAALWLSSSAFPTNLLNQIEAHGSILLDAPQSDIQGNWQVAQSATLFTLFGGQQLSSHANQSFVQISEQDIGVEELAPWLSADGQTLLRFQQQADVKLIQFYSRLNPDWSNVAQQSAFPLLLGKLLFNAQLDAIQKDRRTVAVEQILSSAWHGDNLPENHSSTLQVTSKSALSMPLSDNSISSLLAILLLLLFCAERVLSERPWLSKNNNSTVSTKVNKR
jgi:hypothetical protein